MKAHKICLCIFVLLCADTMFAQDSLHVRMVGQLVLQEGSARNVKIVGSYAYCVADSAGLRIVDISDPAHPEEVGFYDTPCEAYGVAVAGNYVYVADRDMNGFLRIVDVTNPAAPQEAGFYSMCCPRDVAVAGNYAFIAATFNGLRIVDITNPTAPNEVGYYNGMPQAAVCVVVAGNYAYVANTYDGLRILNIANPAAPTVVGFYDTPGTAMGVDVSENRAYVADFDRGLRVVNITNPAAPVEVGHCDMPGQANGVAVAGSYAYVADGSSGLRVVNITNPAEPVEVGFYDTPGEAFGVAVVGNYAYVSDSGYFGIYDCSAATAGVRAADPSIPARFSLHPCYPNPFNAATTIAYDLPATSAVQLDVFDVLGRRVQQFNYGMQTAGTHELRFDGTGMASGVYFVRLSAGTKQAQQKMVLLR